MTEWQSVCLAQMGIESWERRSIPFRLGIVLPEPLSEATQKLLSAILAAMGQTGSQVTLWKALPEKVACAVLWVMTGESVDVNVPYITSPPLSHLLKAPLEKRSLFESLHPLIAQA